MDLGPSTAVPVTGSSKKTQVPVNRHPHGAVPEQLSTEGSCLISSNLPDENAYACMSAELTAQYLPAHSEHSSHQITSIAMKQFRMDILSCHM